MLIFECIKLSIVTRSISNATRVRFIFESRLRAAIRTAGCDGIMGRGPQELMGNMNDLTREKQNPPNCRILVKANVYNNNNKNLK